MSDLPAGERLAKLRALEEWLDWQLADTRRKIRQVEADLDRQEALLALGDESLAVEMCGVCNPEPGLRGQ